jgi:hypothetical protein
LTDDRDGPETLGRRFVRDRRSGMLAKRNEAGEAGPAAQALVAEAGKQLAIAGALDYDARRASRRLDARNKAAEHRGQRS